MHRERQARQLLVKPARSSDFLGIANANPDAALAEEILQSAVYDAQRSGLDAGRTVDLVIRLVEAGREIAAGGTGCDPLQSAINIVQGEVAAGRITQGQAAAVLDEIDFVRSVMNCS
ncbi:MAG TPA: hypothetical protein VLV78_04465 [Thermoanaerobaculia bacterium]|nr:hypothetical protein [Thermoanaerobaculia bacterium]